MALARKIVVNTNAFTLDWDSSGQIFHYQVIRPNWPSNKAGADRERPPIGQAKGYELVTRLQKSIAPGVFTKLGAFDGKSNLYSFKRYVFSRGNTSGGSWEVPWDNSGSNTRSVTIAFSFIRTADFGTVGRLEGRFLHDACNILTLAVQSEPRSKKGIYNAKSFFTDANKQFSKNAAPLEFWRGFYQSVRPTSAGLIVNVDVTAGVVLPERELLDVCAEYIKARNPRDLDNLDKRSMTKLKLFLQGVKVTIKLHASSKRRPKTIKDVVADVGRRTFDTKEGETLTVAEHFRRVYNVPIPPGMLGVKTSDGNLFPITACRTICQLFKKTSNPEIVMELLKFAPKNPALRLQAITDGWNHLAHRDSEMLLGAQISIRKSPLAIEGEVLPPPVIGFREAKPSVVHELERDPGQWNMKGKPLLVAASFERWAVIDWTNSPSSETNTFIGGLIRNMRDRGITLSNDLNRDLFVKRSNPSRAKEDMMDVARAKPELIVALLPERAPEVYWAVKRVGDIMRGIPTQCIKWTSRRAQAVRQGENIDQYLNNVILKINPKMGGINWFPICDAMGYLKSVPTIVIGADVSHPGPGSHFPSVAALVGSLDGMMSRYMAVTRPQESRVEMISEIAAMFESLLRNFATKNGGTYPRRILFYRDGVSEGEFETVRRQEFAKIQEALGHLYGPQEQGKWPEIAVIVVGKRHHIRFFPEHSRDAHRNGNLPPGFVASDGIDHLRYNDFYLQSQAGLLGTSRPSHYTVLFNILTRNLESEGSAPVPVSLEDYALCHCYSRSSSSVKVPAPVYYADLVCRRAKFHLDETAAAGLDDDLLSVQSGSSVGRNLQYFEEHWSDVNEKMQDKMYFV